AGEHLVAPVLDLRLACEPEKQVQRLFGDPVLRVVDEQVAELQREGLEALGVVREERAHLNVAHRSVVAGEGLPGWRRSECAHDGSEGTGRYFATQPSTFRRTTPATDAATPPPGATLTAHPPRSLPTVTLY